MLALLRHKTIQRWLFIALCVLIIPGFVFMSTASDSGMSGNAGKIGGRKIKVQEFIRNYEAMRRELEVFSGADLSRMGNSVDLEALTWQRILLVDAAKEAGIKVTDADVIAWIQEQKVFAEDGKFSQERYNMIIERYLKIDVKRFEEECREYLSLQRYRDQVRGTYSPGAADLQTRFEQLYGPRELAYVVFTKESVTPPAAATEEDLQSMYSRLSGRLFAQEAVSLKYISLPAGSADPLEAEENGLWESASVRTPLLSREEPITGIGSAPELMAAAFDIKNAGEKTAWMEHDGKRYRFELVEHKPQTPMTYEDAKKVLAELVGQEKTFRAVIEKASEFSDAVEKSGWASAVAAQKLAPLTLASYTPGDYIEKVGKLPRVSEALAGLEVGKTSGPLPTSNGLVIFNVVSQAKPDAALFESKRDEIERNLKLKHEMEVFGKAYQALQTRLTVDTKTMSKLFPAPTDSPTSN
ncbi:MAG: peptidylprolyl isomerase [Candidatus Omnitrophica bacterium]|nr:peptidylprolyl isomerase [Candidatus Omnitrophota bacterium]